MAGPGGKAGLFGGIIEGLGSKFVEQKQQKHKEEQDAIKRQFDAGMLLFDKGFEDIGATLLGHTISSQFQDPNAKPGSKGAKAKNPIQAFLQNPLAIGGLLKGLHKGIGAKAEGGGGSAASENPDDDSLPKGTDAASGAQSAGSGQTADAATKSPFRTREEGEQATEASYKRKKTFDTDEGIRAAKAEGRYNKPGTWTPGTTSGKDLTGVEKDTYGNPIDKTKSYKVREAGDGSKEVVPVEGKAKTDNSPQGRLAKRFQSLDPDLTPEAADKKAASRLEEQDKLTDEQKKGRYTAFMRASDNGANLSTERLKEMQALYPFHVAAAEAKGDMDAFRASIASARTAQGAAKALQTAQAMAEKMIAKRGIMDKVSGWFGGLPTNDQVIDGLLQEAGQDPENIRALAKDAYKTVTPPAVRKPGASSSADPGVFKKDAQGNYLISTGP
jgi:hypothetical protein